MRRNGAKISSAPPRVPAVVRGKSPDSVHRAREATRAFTDNLTPVPEAGPG
ncbi:hypothetical protein SAMN05216511_4848 [Streptomyces sp. KS_16]|nr:hypothetical protein BX261_2358 [Streptomyces sp. 2321.6]SDR49544.1 hypothetical protein SAMN05216511_4848 [Streptomyces sp. KS_16]SEC58746.1 hypothetical protein SAMN05428940_2360 [Streptomyces sp. 2133.1]SNC68446.1 hypothetical protein SAMN06272741_2355 [Streptomyces sp. 2114.4]